MPSKLKTRQMIQEALSAGINAKDGTVTAEIATLPSALVDYVRVDRVLGPIKKVTLTLDDMPHTLLDASVGAGIKILDLPEGLLRIRNARIDSLTYKVTSVLADTLNASKVVNVALGTATQSTATMVGTAESNIIPVTATTSPATIDTANTAFSAQRDTPMVIDGSTTAGDVYLNFAIPTAGDIDANATITVSGTIVIEYEYVSDIAPTNASRMPSASIWSTCPEEALKNGELDGYVYFNDFVTGSYTQTNNVAASATTVNDGGMCAFTGSTAGGTVGPSLSAPHGVIELKNTTDGETTCIQFLGNKNIAGQVVFEANKRVWAEFYLKVANVTANEHGVFIGFGEEGLATAAGVISTADAITDKDFIGFFKPASGTTAVDTIHNTAGGGGVTTLAAAAATLAADTYIKLGIVCDGTTIFFYVNGTVHATSVALSATNVPDGEEMAGYIALVVGSGGGDCTVSVDWVKVAMQRA